MTKLKLGVLAFWIAALCVTHALYQTGASAQAGRKPLVEIPESSKVEDLDRAIQKRFLSEPFFGIARIMPATPQPLRSGHVGGFSPNIGEEAEIVDFFRRSGWRVGIYLYGRRATPREKDGKPTGDFDIRYRVNEPVPVTFGLKEKDLPGAKRLVDEVKEAFLRFQAESLADTGEVSFRKGDWSFVAKPVRAVNESCIRCHTDYVITQKVGEDRYAFRKRAVGDVNGVIVYGFSKDEDD